MNIIEAAKELGKGNDVKCLSYIVYGFEFKGYSLRYIMQYLSTEYLDNELASNDWEVVKKPLVWEGETEWWHSASYDIVYPNNREVKRFVGKRTKTRIEEII